jgi:hypothetical protein
MSDIPTGKNFSGVKLFPVTPQRQEIAAAMGIRAGFVTKYKDQFFLQDIRIMLWLCSVDEKRLDEAELDIDKATKDSREWAKRMGIGINNPAYTEGVKVFSEIYSEIINSRAEPIIPASDRFQEQDESGL